jgi:hypothetical protein
MRNLNRLSGVRRYPPGVEWLILKRLPLVLLASTATPLCCYLVAYLFPTPAIGETVEKHLATVGIAAVATAVTAWTAVFTVAIGCLIVVLMKGPAYVADQYPLVDADQPAASEAEAKPPDHPCDPA